MCRPLYLVICLVSILAVAQAALAAEDPPGTDKQVKTPGRLSDLLTATGLKHLMQDETTAVVLFKGDSGTHVVTVRLLDQVLAAFAEIVAVPEAQVPTSLWKKAAQANMQPSLAHVGYSKLKSKFYALSGLADASQVTGPLLRAMITDVALLADELQPSFQDLLAVE